MVLVSYRMRPDSYTLECPRFVHVLHRAHKPAHSYLSYLSMRFLSTPTMLDDTLILSVLSN